MYIRYIIIHTYYVYMSSYVLAACALRLYYAALLHATQLACCNFVACVHAKEKVLGYVE